MNILVFGGSRNIGYMAALRFLGAFSRHSDSDTLTLIDRSVQMQDTV